MADALISIVGSQDQPAAIPHGNFKSILRLKFDDVAFLGPWRSSQGDDWVGITKEQFTETLAFGKCHTGHIAVHCLQGKSRSAAIALAILANRHHESSKAFTILMDGVDRRVMPNPGLVRLIDQEIEIYGPTMHETLMEKSDDFRWWVSNWRAEGWR